MSYQHVKDAERALILITWMFKYKFDTEDYLIKHKVRLCAKKNFQQTD